MISASEQPALLFVLARHHVKRESNRTASSAASGRNAYQDSTGLRGPKPNVGSMALPAVLANAQIFVLIIQDVSSVYKNCPLLATEKAVQSCTAKKKN
jgi:hypothetical protein